MCGRYALSADAQSVQEEFRLDELPELAPRYNIAPSQPVPIITAESPHELMQVKWGLVPSWAKDEKIGYKMINARAETADTKPSFRAAFKRRRCIIPTSGFYEWVKTDDGKQPYFIYVPGKSVVGFAGLYEIWNSPEGSELWTCTILTGEPNETVRPLHHRMAVLLDEDQYEPWLHHETDAETLKQMLATPFPSERMDAYPVSKAVNSPKTDHPRLIERDNPPVQNELL